MATYDLQPEMSAPELTDKLVAAIRCGTTSWCNYANGDMVGHTGILAARHQGGGSPGRVPGAVEEALLEVGGEALVTADHGNAEQMLDYESGSTIHSTPPTWYPWCLSAGAGFSNPAGGNWLILRRPCWQMMGLPQPPEMSGPTWPVSPTDPVRPQRSCADACCSPSRRGRATGRCAGRAR